MEKKVQEYDEVINWMGQQYHEAQRDHQDVIDFIDTWYEEQVEKLSPRFVRKRWVKNKGRGEGSIVIVMLSTTLLIR